MYIKESETVRRLKREAETEMESGADIKGKNKQRDDGGTACADFVQISPRYD